MSPRLICVLIASLCLLASPAIAQTLRIYHIDVEQADAALIVMPNGKSLLIDAGKNGHGKRVKKVMDEAGVTQIDAFVASHFHEDHFGGVDDLHHMGVPILESFDRGHALAAASNKAQKTFKGYLETIGEDAHRLHPGDVIQLDPLVEVRCISANGVAVNDGSAIEGDHDENDLSVSLLLSFRGFKAFFGGDIETPTEAVIAAADLVTDVDLYKADHHGSDTSSSPALLADLRPSLVVVSNGSNKTYKHPRRSTLDAYAGLRTPPTVLQTNLCKHANQCGNVESAFIGDPQSNNQAGTILITVDGATSTYTAKWGTTVRPFQFKNPTGGPTPASSPSVVIASVLPNPTGDDEQLEEIAIRNASTQPVDLTGWMLKDRSGLIWVLTGTLTAGTGQTFRRNRQPMSLNNAGDEILLIDAAGVERDRFNYGSSSQGQRILTNH